jgi:hypothetical protein
VVLVDPPSIDISNFTVTYPSFIPVSWAYVLKKSIINKPDGFVGIISKYFSPVLATLLPFCNIAPLVIRFFELPCPTTSIRS